MISSFSPFTNPFARSSFWGREKELGIIWGRLLSNPPQSLVIIGEPFIGKTTLVKCLIESPPTNERGIAFDFTFIYLDCKRYIRLVNDWQFRSQAEKGQSVEQSQRDMSNYAAALFWWDLYNKLPGGSQEDESFSEPGKNDDEASLLDAAYDISFAIEKWIQSHTQPVIFILDNFEGMARLPLRNSDRLRSLADHCAFILTSRYALYVLYNYHLASWAQPSPFYNFFSDTIYLSLLPEQEVDRYLTKAAQEAEKSGCRWSTQDTAFIRRMAGRHPELLRLACARMFEERLLSQSSSEIESNEQDYEFLLLRLVQDGHPLCKQLWEGLANPELYGLVGAPDTIKREASALFSPYQLALIDIAHGRTVSDPKILFELEQRGLIERVNDKWRIFSEVLQQFVFLQEKAKNQASNGASTAAPASFLDAPGARDDEPTLTYMESRVYDYLRTHLGDVCDKTEIMQAIWGEDNMPSNSALQKIIERIREKIEDEPDSPYKLISVRGRGYMLRRTL